MTKKILIIDDDQDMCEEMAEILKNEGYYVNMIPDGSKGNILIQKYDYDVILLDLKLPGLSGLDILKSTKAKKTRTKVLVLTGRPLLWGGDEESHDSLEEEAIRLADAIINKPFNIETVLDKIKELILQEDLT